MNLISNVPLAICSLRKCITGFLDRFMALVLSKWIGILFKRIPKSLSCCLTHRVWAQQLPAAMYSASVVERTTQACFLQCQEIRLDPRMWNVPLVLFLSILQPAKYESEKLVKLKENMLECKATFAWVRIDSLDQKYQKINLSNSTIPFLRYPKPIQ